MIKVRSAASLNTLSRVSKDHTDPTRRAEYPRKSSQNWGNTEPSAARDHPMITLLGAAVFFWFTEHPAKSWNFDFSSLLDLASSAVK